MAPPEIKTPLPSRSLTFISSKSRTYKSYKLIVIHRYNKYLMNHQTKLTNHLTIKVSSNNKLNNNKCIKKNQVQEFQNNLRSIVNPIAKTILKTTRQILRYHNYDSILEVSPDKILQLANNKTFKSSRVGGAQINIGQFSSDNVTLNSTGMTYSNPHQSIDKDKIEKSIRKMRAYQKFMKVFNSSKGSSNSKKDTDRSSAGSELQRKESEKQLKRSNTKNSEKKSNSTKQKRLNFKEKGKLNSEIINFQSQNKNMTIKISPNILNDKTGEFQNPLPSYSRRSSFGENPLNSNRSLNNTQALFLNDQNYNSLYNQNSEFENIEDFKRSKLISGSNVLRVGKQSMVSNYGNEDDELEDMEEFRMKGLQYNQEESQSQECSQVQEDFIDYTEQLGELNLTMIIQKRDHKRNCKSIEPDNLYKSIWDVIGMAMIVYQAIMIPYRLSFGDAAEGALEVFEYIMDSYFLIDIALSFFTGYYNQGQLIMNKRLIIVNYLKTWFVIDLVSSFPYTWIFDNLQANDNSDYSQTNFQAPQLLRLIRIFEELLMNDGFTLLVDFCKLFVIMFFIIHWLGCFFFAIGSYEAGYGSDSWLRLASLDKTNDYQVQYITSVYWAFLTMATIGYGDIFPVTPLEKCYVMVCMIIACAVFAYLVGYIGSILDKSETVIQEFKIKALQIKQFMSFHNLPANFKNQVKRYLDYVVEYKRQYKMEEEEVLEMLSEGLRFELIIHLNGKMLHNTAIFKNFDIQFLSELTFILKKETLSDDYKLFDEGDHGNTLYFITKGSIILVHKQSHTYIKELGIDDFLGEVAFFSDLTRKATARSKNMTEVLILDQNDFLQQALLYPNVYNTYIEMKSQVNNHNDLSNLGVICYLCEQNGHVAIDCTMFNIIKGNLKKHAYDKIKKIQKLLTQQSRRRLRRAQSRLNLDADDSIHTEDDFQESSMGKIDLIREATNEDDESEQLEADEETKSFQSVKLSSDQIEVKSFSTDSEGNDDEGLDFDKKGSKYTNEQKPEDGLRKQESIRDAKHKIRQNNQKNKDFYQKRNSILKSLTFKAQTKSKSPPTKSMLQIHEIEEEKSETDSSLSSHKVNQNKRNGNLRQVNRKRSSLKHSVTMKELTQIISKVKLSTDQNQKLQKNSMIAKGIKFALREINKEIRRKSSTKANPLQALAKKFQFLNAHNSAQMQSQEILSNTRLDKDINLKLRTIKKVGTLRDASSLNQPQSTPKMRNMTSNLGGFSSIQHALSSKFKADIKGSNGSGGSGLPALSHQSSNLGFSKLAIPNNRGVVSKQGTFYEMEKFSQASALAEEYSAHRLSQNISHQNSKLKLVHRRSEQDSLTSKFPLLNNSKKEFQVRGGRVLKLMEILKFQMI
eukprot:403349915